MFVVVTYQSMIGHGLGAAGGIEAIVTIKAITTGWLHPTINQHVLLTNFSVSTRSDSPIYVNCSLTIPRLISLFFVCRN